MAKEKFGPYITSLREQLGLSKAELARRTGMTRAYIGFIEDDAQPPSMEPPNVSARNLIGLARELNVPEQEMFDRGYRSPPGFKLVPAGPLGPATQLVREKAAQLGNGNLDPSDLDDLSSEVDDFAQIRVERVMRQGGRQLQKAGG